MPNLDVDALVERMLKAVRAHVAKMRDSLALRIDELTARVDGIPRGEKGDPGVPGKDAVLPDISAMVDSAVRLAVDALPRAKDGVDGKPGLDADPALIKRLIDEGLAAAVASLPKAKDGRDGKDAVLPDIPSLVAAAVAALPKAKDGRDGKDAVLPDLAPIIASAVMEAVAKLPKAKDGRDGRDGKDVDMKAVGELIMRLVDESTFAAVAKLPKAKDGRDADMEALGNLVASLVEEKIAALPAAKDGAPGKDGRDGKDAPVLDAKALSEEIFARVMSAVPVPRNGLDGRDAAALDILPSIDEKRSYRRGTWASYRGGLIRAVRETEPVDGTLEKAGWEVMVEGISALEVVQGKSAREISVVCSLSSGKAKEQLFKLPVLIYRGVWREGEYEQGDVVTWGGSAWHCQEPTTEKPGASSAWKLMVKEGQRGKDGGPAGTAKREPVKG